MIGDYFIEARVHYEDRKPFILDTPGIYIEERTTILGACIPTEDASCLLQIALPFHDTEYNRQLILDIVSHELIHDAIINVEDWYTSAELDDTSWILKQVKKLAESIHGYGYER